MKILVTNDDGVNAPGLKIMAQELAKTHDIVIVAPEGEQSAVSHGITLNRPLRMHSLNGAPYPIHAVAGTPSDCIKLALAKILNDPVDLVISGINAGANVGIDINYSGTVAAAREAALAGIPALAISCERRAQEAFPYLPAAQLLSRLVKRWPLSSLPKQTVININYPAIGDSPPDGIAICPQSTHHDREAFIQRNDPRDQPYFWYDRSRPGQSNGVSDDRSQLARNHVVVTPIRCQLTDHRALETIRDQGWIEALLTDDN